MRWPRHRAHFVDQGANVPVLPTRDVRLSGCCPMQQRKEGGQVRYFGRFAANRLTLANPATATLDAFDVSILVNASRQ